MRLVVVWLPDLVEATVNTQFEPGDGQLDSILGAVTGERRQLISSRLSAVS